MVCRQSRLSLGGRESREGCSAGGDCAQGMPGPFVKVLSRRLLHVNKQQQRDFENDRILGSLGEERKPPGER